jgi:hypothetical protein
MDLKSYRPGENGVYRGSITRPWSDEVYGSDMNAWLIQNEPRIGYRLPVSQSHIDSVVKALSATNSKQTISAEHLLRRRGLDDALDKAIARAGNYNPASVGNALLELLDLGTLSPFIPPLEKHYLTYRNDVGNAVELTKESLAKRLSWRNKKAKKIEM